MNDEIYSLCEAVADIAYIAGEKSFYTGNSRESISLIISWAEEFESLYNSNSWIDLDYIETIEKFTENKMKEYA